MDMKNITIEEARARISPTSDIFARWLLSAPNHEHLTKAFINAVLEDAGHEQIASVTILSPFNLAQSMTRKETVLDVKVSRHTVKKRVPATGKTDVVLPALSSLKLHRVWPGSSRLFFPASRFLPYVLLR